MASPNRPARRPRNRWRPSTPPSTKGGRAVKPPRRAGDRHPVRPSGVSQLGGRRAAWAWPWNMGLGCTRQPCARRRPAATGAITTTTLTTPFLPPSRAFHPADLHGLGKGMHCYWTRCRGTAAGRLPPTRACTELHVVATGKKRWFADASSASARGARRRRTDWYPLRDLSIVAYRTWKRPLNPLPANCMAK